MFTAMKAPDLVELFILYAGRNVSIYSFLETKKKILLVTRKGET
jgi:hypothetical protein